MKRRSRDVAMKFEEKTNYRCNLLIGYVVYIDIDFTLTIFTLEFRSREFKGLRQRSVQNHATLEMNFAVMCYTHSMVFLISFTIR